MFSEHSHFFSSSGQREMVIFMSLHLMLLLGTC
jgi:hypothetical protein